MPAGSSMRMAALMIPEATTRTKAKPARVENRLRTSAVSLPKAVPPTASAIRPPSHRHTPTRCRPKELMACS
ncbi:hypothetical protein D3C73_1633770 [compost metagenome]